MTPSWGFSSAEHGGETNTRTSGANSQRHGCSWKRQYVFKFRMSRTAPPPATKSSLVSRRSESVLLRLLSALLPVVLLRVLVIPAPLLLPLSRRTPCLRGLPDGYFNRRDQFHTCQAGADAPNIVVFLCVFATCEWHCVNVGMSMRWRGRLAPTATFFRGPAFVPGAMVPF